MYINILSGKCQGTFDDVGVIIRINDVWTKDVCPSIIFINMEYTIYWETYK